MALTTAFKRIAKLGGNSKFLKTTTKLGTRAKEVLGGLSGKTKVVSRAKAAAVNGVKNTASDASKSRKILSAQVVNKPTSSLGIKSAASKVIKGAAIGGLIALPLAATGYGVKKLGDSVGKVRQGFFGASPEDLSLSRLDVIEKIVDAGGNPADYGFTEQNLPDRKDGTDSPQFLFANEQPVNSESPASVGDQITKVVLVGGAVAGGLFIINALAKKRGKK